MLATSLIPPWSLLSLVKYIHREKGLVTFLSPLLNSLNWVCLPITDHFFSNIGVDNMYGQQTWDTYEGIIIHDHYMRILGTVNIVKFEGNVIAACRTIYARLFDEKQPNKRN